MTGLEPLIGDTQARRNRGSKIMNQYVSRAEHAIEDQQTLFFFQVQNLFCLLNLWLIVLNYRKNNYIFLIWNLIKFIILKF